MKLLRKMYGAKIIANNGPVHWPTMSPDLIIFYGAGWKPKFTLQHLKPGKSWWVQRLWWTTLESFEQQHTRWSPEHGSTGRKVVDKFLQEILKTIDDVKKLHSYLGCYSTVQLCKSVFDLCNPNLTVFSVIFNVRFFIQMLSINVWFKNNNNMVFSQYLVVKL